MRCKVAPGTPPLNNMTIYERPTTQEVIILAATVSSVHRLIFPHPDVLDKKVNLIDIPILLCLHVQYIGGKILNFRNCRPCIMAWQIYLSA